MEVRMENYKNSKIGRETAQKYGDILEMERPQTEESLRKHPRMTLQNRAKIFSPFSPLRGYDEQLAAEKQRAERVAKRILTEEEKSALSDRLMQVTKGMTITVKIWWRSAGRASWTSMHIWEPDFFTSRSSEMWEKGRSKDSDFPPVCLCRGCIWEENTV